MNPNRLELLQNMLLEDPKDSFVLFAIAKEYEVKQDYSTAIDYYEKLRSNDPNYVGLYYHLGKSYEEVEKIDKAAEIFKIGIDTASNLKDQHALSELKGVLMNLEIEHGL